MHAAENAVLAKLRAMYARRLTAAQFSEILSCRTMGEVALYLRDKTPYGGIVPVTAGLGDVHREWLEERLRQASYSRFEAVGHYAFAIDAPFYRYFVLEHEAERLIRTLSLSVRGGGALPEASAFFLRHSVVDWLRVGQAKTPQQWLSALSGTPYHALCAPFIGPEGVDMVLLDRSLERHKMRALLQLADTCYGGAQHDALRQQLMIRIDMSDIAALYRAVLLGQRAGVAVTGGGLLTERQLSQLSAAPDEAAFISALGGTRYAGKLDPVRDGSIERTVDRYLFRLAQHTLHRTPYPSVALLSYATLHRTELRDLIHSIEGVRYGASGTAAGILVGVEI